MKLTGIFADLPTPFAFDGSLYRKKIEQNIARYNLLELSGYLIGSTLGEGGALTADERADLWRLSKAASADGKVLLAGLPEMGLRPALEALEGAARAGFDAALVRVPVWPAEVAGGNQPSSLFLRTLADQSPLPLIVQSGEANKAALAAGEWGAIAQHPGITGIYTSSADVEYLRAAAEAAGPSAPLLTGEATILDVALAGPAAAAIVGLAAAVPYHCLSIADAVRKREYAAAEQLRLRLTPAAEAIGRDGGVAGLKWAMDLRGYYGGPPRLPLTPLAPERKRQLESLLKDVPN